MIVLTNVRKVFHQGKPDELVAVNDVSLAVEEHTVTVLKGPSGSGKTTLLGIVGCMVRPTAGRVTLSGREITSLPERFLTGIRRSTFGFIFQQYNLIRGITVLENVMLPAYPLGGDHAALRKRALGLLAILGIAGRAQARIEWLSGGEAQRTAIARALINDPPVIIADEPTAHLDTARSEEFMGIIAGFKRERRTVIIASHDPLVCDAAVVDRVLQVRDGRIGGAGR